MGRGELWVTDPRLRGLYLDPSVSRDALGAAREGEPDGDQQKAEDQEPDIPPNRSAEVIADVVDAEELVIDYALSDVEHAPSGEQHPEVPTPRWGQLAPLPCTDGEQHRGRDKSPRREVEEPVRERVRFQSRHSCHGVVPSVGQHVVPLEDLVEDDAIPETTESEAHDERGGSRRSCPSRPVR
jgi:hypothetical protein